MTADLISIPWQIQVVLAAGYIGYSIGYAGRRQGHGTVDIAMISLVFSLAASGILALTESLPNIISAGCGVVGTITMGAIWRFAGYDLWFRLQRRLQLSISTGQLSGWALTSDLPKRKVSQLQVHLDNGRRLFCADAGQFKDEIDSPIIFGSDGSIALVVTHIYNGTELIEEVDFSNRDWGINLTYVPSNRISEVNIRSW